MRLNNTTNAPTFKKQDLNGTDFDLSSPRNKLILLAFFRYASCPLCNLRVHELIQHHNTLKKDLEIIAVFQSPPDKIRQYVGKQKIPFKVLPDPERILYHLYGVESSWLGFAKAWTVKIMQVFSAVLKHQFLPGSFEGEIHRIPADFIIGTDNRIIEAYYGSHIGDHLPLTDIYQLIGKHETGQ